MEGRKRWVGSEEGRGKKREGGRGKWDRKEERGRRKSRRRGWVVKKKKKKGEGTRK